MSENRKPFETFAHYKLGKGYATLSVSVDEGNAVVGISYCHPRDGINKGRGREIAAARRDVGSDFSFEFRRNKDKLGTQLRAEFENYMAENRDALLILLASGIKDEKGKTPRVGAPPWALHSFNREIRKRARLENTVVEHTHPDTMDCGCL